VSVRLTAADTAAGQHIDIRSRNLTNRSNRLRCDIQSTELRSCAEHQ